MCCLGACVARAESRETIESLIGVMATAGGAVGATVNAPLPTFLLPAPACLPVLAVCLQPAKYLGLHSFV